MRAALSVQDVLADPIGAYLAGKSFVVWFHPRLAGAFAFGRLHPADDAAIAQLLISPVLAPGYDLLCDCGAVELLDDRGFEILKSALDHHGDLLARIRRLGLVRPGGVAGAAFAGLFYERVRPVVEAGLFVDRFEALSWLGYARDAPERVEIDELIATIHQVPPVLRGLREFLIGHFAAVTLADAAKALGASKRSLQRELGRAKTSFRAELTRVRMRMAESLLTTTDEKIEAIARQLGFTSVPAFTTLFGRVVGENPNEFRHRRSSTRR